MSVLLFPPPLPFLQAALGWSPCGRSWPPSRAPTPGFCRSPQSAWPWTFMRWVPRLPRLPRSVHRRLAWVSPDGQGSSSPGGGGKGFPGEGQRCGNWVPGGCEAGGAGCGQVGRRGGGRGGGRGFRGGGGGGGRGGRGGGEGGGVGWAKGGGWGGGWGGVWGSFWGQGGEEPIVGWWAPELPLLSLSAGAGRSGLQDTDRALPSLDSSRLGGPARGLWRPGGLGASHAGTKPSPVAGAGSAGLPLGSPGGGRAPGSSDGFKAGLTAGEEMAPPTQPSGSPRGRS